MIRKAVAKNHEVMGRLKQLRQEVVDNGCDVNICFVLQGDDFVTDEEFEDEVIFVDLFIAIITTNKSRNFCAVQYGSRVAPVSRLTNYRLQFLDDLRRTKRVGGSMSNITGALEYIGSQLHGSVGNVTKVVYLGDGIESIPTEQRRPARELLNPNNTGISAVAVGQFDIPSLIEITGDENKIFHINDFFVLAEAFVVLTKNVCGLSS